MGLTQRLGTIPLAIQTDSSNNVGIGGAANASYKLDVTGTIRATGSIFGDVGFRTKSLNGYLLKNDADSANLGGLVRRSYWAGGAALDTQIFAETGYGIFLNVNGSSSTGMVINSSGNVGIGTSGPAAKLTIFQGADSVTNGLRMYRSNGSDWQEVYMTSGFGLLNDALTFYSSFAGRNVAGIDRIGQIASITAGVDGSYNPSFISVYTGNTNESNAISTTVSSVASNSGFRFDVSNGAGATGRTASMYINRTSVTVVGSLSKGSGSFKIDHPIESMSETHHLVHSFVESPQANNIYRGKVQLVNGKAEVNLDEVSTMTEGTFVLLNRDIHTYTSNETDWDAVRGKVDGNILTIECQNNQSNAMVSWLVIGERQDKHMMDTEWTDDNGKVIVEPLKEEAKVTALENK